MICSITYAYDFEVDGLCYNIIGSDQVEVTYRSLSDGSYVGTLQIPETVVHNDVVYRVTSIGEDAFNNCIGLTGSLTIPNSITKIGIGAFSNCRGLTGELRIPNTITKIAESSFFCCEGFTSLTIPNSVTKIGSNAFNGCCFTGSLIIPNSVNYIGEDAFANCWFSSITIPNSVTYIGNEAFLCMRLVEHVYSKITSPIYIANNTFLNMSSNAVLHIPEGTKEAYNQYEGWTCNFNNIIDDIKNETPPVKTWSLSINVGGKGSVSYEGETLRGTVKNYTVVDGASFTISLTPDDGYQIKSLKVNGTTVTVSDSYTFTVNSDTSIDVQFEAIPPTTYTLTISAKGNGRVTYVNSLIDIRNNTNTFTLNEGTLFTIQLRPDYGYQIKSLKVNDSAITTSKEWADYKTTINSNTTVEVEFEAIPATTYTLSITAIGNGSATYGISSIRNTTSSFTVNEGTSVSISFTPDSGYRIKSLKVNNSAVTASSNYSATINADISIEVEFEAIPPKTYTLSIKTTGNGSASYGGEAIRNTTKSYTINEGTSVSVSFSPDAGYRIKSLKVNNTAVTASSSYSATINANTTIEVEFESIPPTTFTLSIKATGNGSASYGGEAIRNTTKSYTINEGTSVSVSFSPDAGYRIKSLKVNNSAVTASSSYSATINANTSIEVEFEAMPPTTFTLSIKAIGNGSASYGGEAIRNTTKTYTINEGTSVSISFTPDSGYRIKSLKVNNSAVTASSSYSATINANTSIEVEFEVIPPTTYTLSIKATGNGSATYSGTAIKNTTKSFTVNEGTSCTVSFTPDNGYRIKSLKVNSTSVTASTSYIVTVNANTSIEVEFEAIPATTYTLSITATGNGSASYSGTSIRGTTKSFTVNEGSSCTISFTPDNGYRIKSLKVNGISVTASTSYTVTVNANTTVAVEFEAIPATTYTLSITATGNGSASYNGTSIRGVTKSFTVNEGTSATISFTPDNGYRIKSLKVNGTSVTASTSYTVKVNSNTTVAVEFEAIPQTTYSLSIKATGDGTASYGGITIINRTTTFTVNEGTSVTITFEPSKGYRIKSVKVNSTDVTSSLSNNSYTMNITSDTSVEVVFEAIPITTYTLSIKSTGNGYATYSGSAIRGKTSTFTVNEGTSVSITFTPDNGNRIKSVKVNNTDVTSKISNNSYSLSITLDTSVAVEFEEIPDDPDIPKTYTLSIRATGNGLASYNGKETRETTNTYTLEEGAKAVISFTPDDGYQIKSLKINGTSVTASTTYEVTVNSDTSVKVEFEKIPDDPDTPTTHILTIKASGNGIASYEGEIIRDNTSVFTVNEEASVTIAFTPDNGYEISSVIVNGLDVTSEASYHQYTFTMNADTSLEVAFKESESISSITLDGITYQIISDEEQTLMLGSGVFGLILEVPEKIEFLDREWTVVGIAYNALENCEDLAAIIWNPEVAFNAKVTNPNLLLYVKDESYAPVNINNVVVNGYAKSITLTDAASGNNFFCPEAFTAQTIEYSHSYYMKTGLHESRGWETISLPFDVQKISHGSKGEIVPFAKWVDGDNTKPFWLYELSGSGFVEAEAIKANTPYIISMPNNEVYPNEYHLVGRISFSSENAIVGNSNDIQTTSFSNRSLVPNFICRDTSEGFYALNVSNDYEFYQGSENEGSKFIMNLRKLHPFEAYMTSTSNSRSIDIFEGMTTSIREIEEFASSASVFKVYDLSGRLVKFGTSMESIRQELPVGVYIVNNRKMIIK